MVIGRVGSGSGSGRAGEISLTFWKKSDRIRSDWGRDVLGQFICYVFFNFLIDFDWIEGHLISGQVRFESDWISLTFKKIKSDRIQIRTDQTDFSNQIILCHL
jgi:hypothetical protein